MGWDLETANPQNNLFYIVSSVFVLYLQLVDGRHLSKQFYQCPILNKD